MNRVKGTYAKVSSQMTGCSRLKQPPQRVEFDQDPNPNAGFWDSINKSVILIPPILEMHLKENQWEMTHF